MPIIILLLISVIIAVILYYIIYYRPAKRRAERIARHRAYLQRRAELERNNNDFNNCYYNTLLFEFLTDVKNSHYGIYIERLNDICNTVNDYFKENPID